MDSNWGRLRGKRRESPRLKGRAKLPTGHTLSNADTSRPNAEHILRHSGGRRPQPLQPGDRERDARHGFAVEIDFEGVMPRPRQRDIEDEDRAGFHVRDSGRGFPELNRALAAEELRARIIDEADPDPVDADLRPPPPHAQYEVRARMDRREIGHPDVLKDPQDGELSLLVNEGVVGEDREVESQAQLTRIDSMTSFF